MKLSPKVIATALLAASTGAFAQAGPTSTWYGEVGHTWLSSDDIHPTVLRGIVGAAVHPNLAVEGMLGLGLTGTSFNVAGNQVKLSVPRMVGVYLKPKFDVSNEVEVFARLGFNRTTMKSSAAGMSASASESSLSYGLGASYRFSKNWYGTLDYMTYHHKDGTKIDGTTLAVGYRF